ncbi:MAG TPA: hypothetical protein VI653_26680 [Steroidobacteraceae bacterium]
MKAFVRFLAVGGALALGLIGLLLSMCGGSIVHFDRGSRHIDWGAAAYTAAGFGLVIAAGALLRRIGKWSDRDR